MAIPDLLDFPEKAARFDRIAEEAMRERRMQGSDGIGTLSEKWLHQIVKRYLTENTEEHEVRVSEERRFVSDVRIGNMAYEVQTGAFAPMTEKIGYYLEHTDLEVTVVHPIPQKIKVCKIDPATGEFSAPRNSPRHGKPSDILAELYPLKTCLTSPRFHVCTLCLEVMDFKLSDGIRRGRERFHRFERIPTGLLSETHFDSPSDYAGFLPEDLPSPFTVRQFSQATKIRGQDAYSAVRVLSAMGLLEQVENIGRSMGFVRTGPQN